MIHFLEFSCSSGLNLPITATRPPTMKRFSFFQKPDQRPVHVTGKGSGFLKATLSALLLLIQGGCAAVGPDYQAPVPAAPSTWHSELKRGVAAAPSDSSQLAEWWTLLNEPLLTSLIQQAVLNNLDLKQATAKVREARARRGVSEAGLYPLLDGRSSASRRQGSQNSGSGAISSHYAVGFDAAWELDVFGKVRRTVEAAEAELAASREGLHDVLVSLCAEVALTYLDIRILQQRLAVTTRNLAIQQETTDFMEWRYQAGLVTELVFQQARANLENTRAQLPALRSSLEKAKNRLAVLTGVRPGALHGLLNEAGPIPASPLNVAIGVPAETLRQRPDIRRAERTLAAQTARIGVAVADLYPRFRLSGSIGLESLKTRDLFTSGSDTWSIIPGVSWNIFDAGAIRRTVDVQSAVQEQALLAYEGTVLAALEEVENALTAYGEEQQRRQGLSVAVDAARQALELADQLYGAGLADFTTVLDAQRSQLSFDDQLVQSQGAVIANLIRLYKALGGGWHSWAPEQPWQEDINNEQ